MSAIVIVKRPRDVSIFTDGAACDENGVVRAFAPKVAAIPHLSAAITVQGALGVLAAMAALVPQLALSYDDLKSSIEGKLKDVCTPAVLAEWDRVMAPCGSHFDLFVAGWSEERDEGDAFTISSRDRPGIPAWTRLDIEHAFVSPSDDALDADGATILADNDINRAALRIMGRQRAIPSPHCGPQPILNVGGFVQVTAVSRDSVRSRIVHRWPEDVLGQKLSCVTGNTAQAGFKSSVSPLSSSSCINS